MPDRPSSRCPFCDSFDIRRLPVDGNELIGYLCHDCTRVFYHAAVTVAQDEPGKPAE